MNAFDQFDQSNPFDQFDQTTAQREQLAAEMTHPAPPVSRETRATRELPEFGSGGLLAGEDRSKVLRLAPLLLLTSNPQEISQIVRANFPHITQQQDEALNEMLYNPKNRVQSVINKPNMSKLDLLQGLGIITAYTPAGRAGAAVAPMGKAAQVGAGAGAAGLTETVIQTGQAAVGGEFDPEDIAIATGAGGLAEGVGLGVQAVGQARKAKQMLKEAPGVEQIKETARGIYQQIDELGSVVKGESVEGLKGNLLAAARQMKLTRESKAANVLYPKSSAVLDVVEDITGAQNITDIDQLRKVVSTAAQSTDPADAAIGKKMLRVIDDYLENLKPEHFSAKPAQVGKLYENARDLWSRAKKTELLDEAYKKATDQASGFENGLRIQFRAILNNKKKLKGFTEDEIKAMRQVVQGTAPANLARLVGRLGFKEGHATNFLGGSIGVGAGAAAGGPAGAILVPAIGQVSKSLAQKLTKNNAQMANQIVRAGKDGKKVIEAYLKGVPKHDRSTQELTELLLRTKPDLRIKALPQSPLVRDAVFFATYLQKEQIKIPEGIETEVRP